MLIQTKPEPSCPECGARMKLHRPKPGGKDYKPFWGCSCYPYCTGALNIGEDGKPETDYEEWGD